MTGSAYFRDGLLAGRTALVTGGGTGIGRGIALELARLGARVVVAARDRSRVDAAAAEIAAAGGAALAETVNIRKEAEVAALYDRIAAAGWAPDILVNNAGGQFQAEPLAISPNGFRAVIDLNLNGTWLMTHQFAERFIARREAGETAAGSVVNIVLSLFQGLPAMAHSGASRAGVMNLTKSLALAWGRHGITLNCIAPGTIETEAALSRYDIAELKDDIGRLPIKRMGSVEEIAAAAAFLVSPAGAFITGTTLIVDGGEHLLGPVREA